VKLRIALIAVAALVLAGCSAANTGDGGSTAAKDTSPIKLYQISEVQSAAISLPFTKTSAQAAVDEINAKGGINGRKLELTTCNEAADPNTGVKCAQTAVQDPDMVAMVGNFSLFGDQINPVIDAGKIPNIGLDMVSASDAKSATSFPFDIGVPGYAAEPYVAKTYLKAQKVAYIVPDTGGAKAVVSYIQTGAKAAGVDIVAEITVPTDATDYTQFVAKAEDAGATALLSGMTAPGNLALWKALQSTGSKIKTVMSDGGVSAALLQQAGTVSDGNYVISSVPAPTESNAAGKAYLAGMKTYAPDEKVLSGIGMRAWLAVHLFADVASKIDGKVDRASVLKAFNGLKSHKFYWVDDLNFTKAGPISEYPRIVSTVNFVSVIQGGAFVDKDPINPFTKK
jgi:ABC-type branched-subunit amino acid transport system substrate-binding protein